MMPAMRPMMMVMVVAVALGISGSPMPGTYRRGTFGTELPAFRKHAPLDLVRVRDEVGTQPHRIGRAGLAYIDAGFLGSGAMESAQKRTNRQSEPADETHKTHGFPRY
jgi:hypothetical protein